MSRIPDDEKGVAYPETPGGKQTLTMVYEAGLYHLSFASRKPEAEVFLCMLGRYLE